MTPEQQYISDRVVVDEDTECWVWHLSTRNGGYAAASRKLPGQSKYRIAAGHRMSYEAFVGVIPHGLIVRHTCDNPTCVNPKHLHLGTPEDNIDDMLRKNRQAWVCALSEVDVASAREVYANNLFTQAELAAQFGVGTQAMFHALQGIKKGQNLIARVVTMRMAGLKRRDIIAALPHVHPDKISYWLYREKYHRKHKAQIKPTSDAELILVERVGFRAMLPIADIAAELKISVADVARALAVGY